MDVRKVQGYLKSLGCMESGHSYWVRIPRNRLHRVLRELRGLGLYRISSVTGADTGRNIEVLYQIPADERMINVRVSLPKQRPEVETVTGIYPGAVLYERELMEMLGVKVLNHPDPRPLFLSKNSPATPLRKQDKEITK
jgi:membrane-bound hydrogenase subunit beta